MSSWRVLLLPTFVVPDTDVVFKVLMVTCISEKLSCAN